MAFVVRQHCPAILLALGAVILPANTEAIAQAGGSAFDGHYAGFSAHTSKAIPDVYCPRERVPDAVTIANGSVSSDGPYKWAGAAAANGGVTLHNRFSMQATGQIDSTARSPCIIMGRTATSPMCGADRVDSPKCGDTSAGPPPQTEPSS